MKARNPIAKAVKRIRPKIVPAKPKYEDADVKELHELAQRLLARNNRKQK